jgi:uncharacterized MnhB-related membrane protein
VRFLAPLMYLNALIVVVVAAVLFFFHAILLTQQEPVPALIITGVFSLLYVTSYAGLRARPARA